MSKKSAPPVRVAKVDPAEIAASVSNALSGKKDVLTKDLVVSTGHTPGRVHSALKALLEDGKITRRQLTKEEVKDYKAGALPFAYTLR
jgi:hypothetical protein